MLAKIYLTKKEIDTAIQEYVLNSFCFCDSDENVPEVVTAVKDVNIIMLDKDYKATVLLEREV